MSPRVPEQAFYVNPGSSRVPSMLHAVNRALLTSYKACWIACRFYFQESRWLLILQYFWISCPCYPPICFSSVVQPPQPSLIMYCCRPCLTRLYLWTTNPQFSLCAGVAARVWMVFPIFAFHACTSPGMPA